VEQSRVQRWPARPAQQTTQSEHAAEVAMTNRSDIPVQNALGGMAIASLCAHLIEVVGQIGADNR
jgi:hypothetical protein